MLILRFIQAFSDSLIIRVSADQPVLGILSL